MTKDISQLAMRQWMDFRSGEPGTCFAEAGFVLDLDEAYAVQQCVSALRVAAGDRIIGYKVGCTGPGTTAQFGMAGPIRGCLFESELRRNGKRIDFATVPYLAVEGEMAIRIGDDGGIAAIFPIIELHQFVFRAPRKTLAELVANNGLNVGIVMPDDIWQRGEIQIASDARLSIGVNGRVLGIGGLWPNTSGPATSLEWLRQHLSTFELSLNPGAIVLAGTPLGLYPVKAGDDVSVFVGDNEVVRCSVV